jgi:hypothetical protein
LKTAEAFGWPLNDASTCLTIVMRCATDAKGDNKEVSTLLNLVHQCIDISLLLAHVFLLTLFRNVFVLSVLPQIPV